MVEITLHTTGRKFMADGVLTPLGLVVSEHIDKLAFLEPGVQIVSKEVTERALRFSLRLSDSVAKSLDEIIYGYKIGCFRRAREYNLISPKDPTSIFQPDYEVSQ